MNNNNTFLVLAIVAVILFAPFVCAYLMNKRLNKKHPEFKSFFWGYYSAFALLVFQPFLVAGQLHNADLSVLRFGVTFCFLITLPFSVMTIFRKRIGFILLTIITLNPILWIINGVYIKNRWNEF
jgi:drug/metabolite transporter (DMT)-like permease